MEKKVCQNLSKAEFECFLPLITELRQWSDRKKKIQRPLIPSTIFVKTTEEKLPAIYQVSGTHSILKYLGKPAIVKDVEIELLKDLVVKNDHERMISTENIELGETYEISKGSFRGIRAQAVSLHGKFRVALKIEALGSFVLVDIPSSYLTKISSLKIK